MNQSQCLAAAGTGAEVCRNAGDPVSVFHHLGLGFWSLLANPAAGLVQSARGQGPQHFAAGLRSGLSSLVGNVVFAFGSATAKASSSAKKVQSSLPWLLHRLAQAGIRVIW